MRWIALVLPVVLGCTHVVERQASITEFRNWHLTVRAGALRVVLGDDDVSQGAPCSATEDLAGRLYGLDASLELPVVDPGGYIGDDDGLNECTAPRLQIEAPPPPHASMLELRDRSGTVVCELPDLRSARQVTPVDGSWLLTAGAAVAARWSPETDLAVAGLDIWLRDRQLSDELIGEQTVLHDLVNFVVPPAPPGDYQLIFQTHTTVTCAPPAVTITFESDLTDFRAVQPVTIAE